MSDDSKFSVDSWSDAAKVNGFLGRTDIVKCETTPLGAQMSQATTRTLTLTTGASADDSATQKQEVYVLKLGRYENGRMGRHREAAFYKNFAASASSAANASSSSNNNKNKFFEDLMPRVLYAEFEVTGVETKDKYLEKVVIVMEKIDGVDSGLFFGNHSPLNWRFKSEEEITPLLAESWPGVTEKMVALEAARVAAALHAPKWGFNLSAGGNDATLAVLADPQLEHLACREWFVAAIKGDAEPPLTWTAAMDFSKKHWETEVNRLKDSNNAGAELPFGFSRIVVDTLNLAFFEVSTWDNYKKHLLTTPATLVHGDNHPGNHMVRRNSSAAAAAAGAVKIAFVDWEMVRFGFGPQDIAQYVISHAKPEHRRAYEGELLQCYTAELQNRRPDLAAANADGSLAALVRREYVAGGAGRWLWFLPVLAVLCRDNAKMVRYFHDQVAAFLADHILTDGKVDKSIVPIIRC